MGFHQQITLSQYFFFLQLEMIRIVKVINCIYFEMYSIFYH